MHPDYWYIQTLLDDRRRGSAKYGRPPIRARRPGANRVTTRRVRLFLDSLSRRLHRRVPRAAIALDKP